MRTHSRQGARRRYARALITGMVATVFALAACEREAEPGEAGELAEVETGATGIELNEIWPFETPDVGQTVLANALVTGTVGQTGFFARTENNRVFFVEGSHNVTPGSMVRIIGVVQPAVAATFEGWERDFLGTVDAEWDVARTFYIDATSVTPV